MFDPSGTRHVENSAAPKAPSNDQRSKYFDMRHSGRADLTLPASRDDLDRVPAGTAPQAEVLRTSKKPEASDDVAVELALPGPKTIGRGFAEWYESDKGPDGKRGKRTLEKYVGGSIDAAQCEVRDNSCMGDRSKAIIIPILRGSFGGAEANDWKQRKHLEATHEERAALRAKRRVEALRATSMLMQKNCERAWTSSTDPRERKRALFSLWDEIVDANADDEILAEASRAARAHVIGFIRARLPQRDTDAYSADEIARFNSVKQSSETFSPYD